MPSTCGNSERPRVPGRDSTYHVLIIYLSTCCPEACCGAWGRSLARGPASVPADMRAMRRGAMRAPRRMPSGTICNAGTRPSPDDMQAPRPARFHAESAGGPGRTLASPLYIAVCRKHGAPFNPELCTHSNQPPAYKGVRILGAAAGERQKTSPQQRKRQTDTRLKPKGPRLCHVY